MIISFFGHSEFYEGSHYQEKLLNLLEEIAQGEQITFYLGAYGNFDGFALRCAKEYKKSHPDAKICVITPYLGKWLDDRREYFEENYDEIIYPDIEEAPLKFAISKRNTWMVKNADYVIAFVRTHYGGAYQALLHAHHQKKPYTNLYEGNYELY